MREKSLEDAEAKLRLAEVTAELANADLRAAIIEEDRAREAVRNVRRNVGDNYLMTVEQIEREFEWTPEAEAEWQQQQLSEELAGEFSGCGCGCGCQGE